MCRKNVTLACENRSGSEFNPFHKQVVVVHEYMITIAIQSLPFQKPVKLFTESTCAKHQTAFIA